MFGNDMSQGTGPQDFGGTMTDMDINDLKHRAKHCITHHHACDCREYMWKKEQEQLKARVESVCFSNQELQARVKELEGLLADSLRGFKEIDEHWSALWPDSMKEGLKNIINKLKAAGEWSKGDKNG